jgi:transglutaminase-like putative cysteine protease
MEKIKGARASAFYFHRPIADLATAKGRVTARHFEKPEDLSQWLVHEPYLESYAPEIQEAAKRLKGKTEEDTTRNALEFVTKTLKYSGYDPLDHGAQWALREKKGDCTEFTNLFVALCRANRIPARTREGFVVQTLKLPPWVQRLQTLVDTPKHSWAEVYLAQCGWAPLDPLHTYQGAAKFDQLKPIYLYLDCQRRKPVLNDGHFWSITWFSKQGFTPKHETDFIVTSRRELTDK